MGVHRSLVPPDPFRGHRNVFKRAERLAKLKSDGRWSDGMSVFGLPKIRVTRVKAKKKAEAKEEKPAEAAAPAPAPPAREDKKEKK